MILAGHVPPFLPLILDDIDRHLGARSLLLPPSQAQVLAYWRGDVVSSFLFKGAGDALAAPTTCLPQYPTPIESEGYDMFVAEDSA